MKNEKIQSTFSFIFILSPKNVSILEKDKMFIKPFICVYSDVSWNKQY